MKTEYIPKVITLLAGAVVCIVSIVRHMDTTYSLEILLEESSESEEAEETSDH